jgi:CRP-like cAMP-binding protein
MKINLFLQKFEMAPTIIAKTGASMKNKITTYMSTKEDKMDYPNFYFYLTGINPELKPETWKKIETAIKKIDVERGDIVLQEGELITDIIMAGTGCFKSTKTAANGELQLNGMFSSYDFINPISELSINGKSPVSVETLEPGFIYKISWEELEKLSKEDFYVRDFCKNLIQVGFSQPSLNLRELAMVSINNRIVNIEKQKEALAKETQALYVLKNKYEEIRIENPVLIENVMQKLISSYLGVSVSTFLEYFNS